MERTKRVVAIYLLLGAIVSISMACIYTKHDIHVTLDIRHIRESAIDIEDIVSGKKEIEDLEIGAGAALIAPQRHWFAALFDFSTTARAAEDSFQIRALTPALKKAIEARKERFDEVQKQKSAGLVGENNKALLEARLSPQQEKDEKLVAGVKALVAKENADRKVIYGEIARQNKVTSAEDIAKIQNVWAEIHRTKSEKNDWIQTPSDKAQYARFLASPIGKKLPAQPKLGEWVKMPLEQKKPKK